MPMQFKRRACALLASILLCLLCGAVCAPLFGLPAAAEEASPALAISLTASPEELAEPEEITLTFQLTNQTDALLESLCLTSEDGLLVEPIGDIAPGESQTYIRPHAVSAAELEAGVIRYIVTCISGSSHFSYPVEAVIRKHSSEPTVEFLRQVSHTSATDGGSVTIVYEIRNTGPVAIHSLSVTDPLGNFDSRLNALEPGACKRFVQHVSISEDAVSAPLLAYTANDGRTVYTQRLEDLALLSAHGLLDASLTAGRSMFSSDSAEVILTLTNSGNVDYFEVAVYDDIYGGLIADSIAIPAGGEPVEVAHSYPLRSDSQYRWRVTGQTSAGDQIDFVTSTASVSMDDDRSDVLLTLRASTSMPKISRSGYVPVQLEISSIGSATATGVRICEETLGELRELAVVPTGDPTVCTFHIEVRQNTTLTFTASYSDHYGQERIATAPPLEITIGRGGQAPETIRNESSLFGGLSTQISNSPLFMGLLIGSCAVLAVLIVALAITSRRARARRKQRAAERKQRRKEDQARTARFKPVRSGNGVKTKSSAKK